MNDYKLDNLIDAIGSVSDYIVLESTRGSREIREQRLMKWATLTASLVLTAIMGLFALLLSGIMSEPFSPGNTSSVPPDFAIRFESWIYSDSKNIYDTYTGTIQKDLISDGTVEASFSPDSKTLKDIYKKAVEYEIFSIDREMTGRVLDENGGVRVIPLTVYDITITSDGVDYHIHGDYTASFYRDDDKDADNFMNFISYMYEILHSTPEYQKLPDAVGGYI